MEPMNRPRPGDLRAGGGRDHFIDALRVLAVVIVVLGHWTTTSVEWGPDRIRGINALSVIPAARPATWLLQVMPVLFFVGGFANATVSDRIGGAYLPYLGRRLVRLMTPTAVFFAVWFAIGIGLDVADATSPNALMRAAEVAALPLWFLGIYIFVVGLAPVMLRVHRWRSGPVLAGLMAGAVVVDLVRLGFDVPAVGILNYAFVWLFAHQLGFWYREGRLPAGIRALAMAGTGLTGLIGLTLFAGYPVSMVGVPGQERWNTDPPSLCLVFLTLWLVGLALAARPMVSAWAERSSLVAAMNRRVLSVYLWHVSALSLGATVLHALGFPEPQPGSGQWWLLRPVWVAAMLPALALLVAVFQRLEVHPDAALTPRLGPFRTIAAGFAVISLGLAVLVLSVTGFASPAEAAGEVLSYSASPLLGAAHLLVGGSLAWAAWAHRNAALPVTLGAGSILFGAGALEAASPGSLGMLGWNPATARLHSVIGGVALVVTVAAVLYPSLRDKPEDKNDDRLPGSSGSRHRSR